MIVTQTYCDQNTAKTSIVHTFNYWHASCTRNFKNPLASTYSSFTKIPELWPIQISHKQFAAFTWPFRLAERYLAYSFDQKN